MLALEAEGLAAPEAGEDRQALVEDLRADLAITFVAEGRELLVVEVAQSDPHDQAALRKVVQGDGFASHLVHAPARQWRDHGTEADALGARSDRRHHDPGVGGRAASTGDEVVPQEEAVPAGSFGLDGQIQQQAGVAEHAVVGKVEAKLQDVRSSTARWTKTPVEGTSPMVRVVWPGGSTSSMSTMSPGPKVRDWPSETTTSNRPLRLK